MSEYTHIFSEAGNGFPQNGDEVLVEGDCGWHRIVRVKSTSGIQTKQWGANYIYLTLEEADRDYDDLDEEAQDAAWNDLHHVAKRDTCTCHGCGEKIYTDAATNHGGENYCEGCESAPAEDDE